VGLRLLAVHTCPLWEQHDGQRRVGLEGAPDHPPVVGWVSVMEVELRGERHRLLLRLEA
jgi:hypothetical protein